MAEFPSWQPDSVLQHRTLEHVVFTWDGTHEQAMQVTEELKLELRMRGARLTTSRVEFGVNHPAIWWLGVERLVDMEEFSTNMVPGDWLVIELFEQGVYGVRSLSDMEGDRMYNRIPPAIRVDERREAQKEVAS